MDYRKIAEEIYDKVGKKENLISAAHCATRLRLVIADNNKCDSKAGQLLLTFDKNAISQAGYDVTTVVLVTNADDYSKVSMEKSGYSKEMDKIITAVK